MTQASYSQVERTLTLTRDYPQPIERVWAAVSTPARIADWMGVEWLGDEGGRCTRARISTIASPIATWRAARMCCASSRRT